jgi:preprotein translocase subunit SecA
MENGMYSFDDFYNTKVGEVGIMAQRANSAVESQKNSLDQLKNVRESISGVSLDEEATKMIEYQKSYEASARMIKEMEQGVADKVLSILPSLGGTVSKINVEEKRKLQEVHENARIIGGESDTKNVASSSENKVGRNDPCPCGSGKKYKKCHGAQ